MRSAGGIEPANEGCRRILRSHSRGKRRFARRGMIVFDRDTFSESMVIILSIAFYRLIFRAGENIEDRGYHNRRFPSFYDRLFAQCKKFFLKKF